MEAKSSLAIVVINWNHAGETIRWVDRVLQWKLLHPRIIVVDNGSIPSDQELLFKALTGKAELILNSVNRGFAGGSNRGIARALELGSDLVALGNYDATFSEETMSRLVEVLARNPGVVAVGPLLREGEKLFAGGRDIGRFLETRRPLPRSSPPESPLIVDYVPGTLILIRTGVLADCGLLDERYFFSGEVADWCARVRAKGMKCAIATEATVDHAVEKSAYRNDLYAYYTFRNRFLYVMKNYRLPLSLILRVYWLVLTTLAVIRAGLEGNRPQRRALLLAGVDGLAGRWGDRNRIFLE